MKKLISLCIIVLAAVTTVCAQDAQKRDTPPPPQKAAYRLDFKIYEMEDGKRSNQREYSMIVAAGNRAGASSEIRVGTRVPISYEEKKITYTNVGLDITCRLTLDENKVWGNFDVSLDGFTLPEQSTDLHGGNPVLRSTVSRVETSIVPGKPLVIASIDDVNSKKRLIVEVTATKID